MGASESYIAEAFALPGTPLGVDRDKATVTGVRVVGPKSRSGHAYPAAVLKAALTRYDNLPVFVGHQRDRLTGAPIDPPPEAKFGKLVNPRMDDDGGVRADLKYNPKHPFAETFAWAAENDPSLYSFSQFARVRWRPETDADGNKVAESFLDLYSADIVSEGGTTSTIFESSKGSPMAKTYDPKEVASGLETTGAKIDFLTGFIQALSGLDQATKDQIVQTVVSAMTASAPTPDPAATDPNAVAPVMNSLRGLGPVGKWAAAKLDGYFVAEAARKRSEWATQLIAAEQVPESLVSDVFVETVAESFGNEARAKALIADRKALTPGTTGPGANDKPKTSPPGKTPSVADLVAGYTRG